METVDRPLRRGFLRDYSLAQQDVQCGVAKQRRSTDDNMWDVWTQYCSELGIDPLLPELDDPIPLLQVYARRLRTGVLAPNKNQSLNVPLKVTYGTLAKRSRHWGPWTQGKL